MCYTPRKIEGGVGALRQSDDTNFWISMANLETSMSMDKSYWVIAICLHIDK